MRGLKHSLEACCRKSAIILVPEGRPRGACKWRYKDWSMHCRDKGRHVQTFKKIGLTATPMLVLHRMEHFHVVTFTINFGRLTSDPNQTGLH